MSRTKRHWRNALIAGAIAVAAVLFVALAVQAQGNAPAGAIRLLGPLYPGYHATAQNPLVNIDTPGMTNLPPWIVDNPARDQTTTNHKIPAAAIDLPSGGGQSGGGGGLATVTSDATLTGDGTASDPLAVANPFTLADENKLNAVEENATRDQTPAEIVADLVSLQGNNRLPARAISGLPAAGTSGQATVISDETLTGDGTSATPLAVAVAITTAQRTDLATLTALTRPANGNKFVGFDATGNLVAKTGTAAGTGNTIIENGTLSALKQVEAVAGAIGVVYGDTMTNNGVYFRTSNSEGPPYQWEKIANDYALPSTIPASNLPVASSSGAGVIQPAEWIKINNAVNQQTLHDAPNVPNSQLEDADAILFDDDSAAVGTSELAEISIAELDKRWLQSGGGGPVTLDRLPDTTQIVSRAVVAGGNRPWPDSNVQIAGPVRSAPYTSLPAGAVWGNTAGRGPGGTTIEPAQVLMRFTKFAYATQPTTDEIPNLRFSSGTDLAYASLWTPTLTGISSDETYWYVNATFTRLPASEETLRLVIIEPTELNLALTDGSVIPADLKFATGADVTGRAITISEGVFTSTIITDTRQLINGALIGLSARDNADSGLARTNLTERLNVTSEPHGIVSGALTLTLSNRSNPATQFHNDSDTITVSFTTTIESIARANTYNGTTNLGRILVVTDVVSGSTQLGTVVLRAAHDAGGEVGVNLRYETSGTTSTGSFSVGAHLEMVVLGSGAPRGIGGSGSWFEYDDKPTDVSAFADGDLILVKGDANQGAYLKTSTETVTGASTALTGKSFSLSANATSARVGNNDIDYFGRSSRPSLPAGGTWTDAPSTLSVMQLAYNHFTLDDGFILIQYSTNQSYSGQIVITTTVAGGNSSAISLRRVTGSNTDWRIDGLSANEVHNLRFGTWTFTEPDHNSYRITHQLTKVLAGVGNEYLLNYDDSNFGLTANVFNTLTESSVDWTRSLTADDDGRSLCVQLTLSSHSQTSRPTWSSPMCVNAGDWRHAATTANGGAFAPNGIYATGTVVDARTAATTALSPLTVMIGKGTNGRLAIRATGAALQVHRIKVWLD